MRNLLVNRVQKAGAAVALLLAISVVLLHFPFGRYDMTRTVWPPGCPPPRVSIENFDGKVRTADWLRQSNEQFQCEQGKATYLRPFEEWISYDAVFPWLIPAKNAVVAVVIVLLAGLTWMWIFRVEPEKK